MGKNLRYCKIAFEYTEKPEIKISASSEAIITRLAHQVPQRKE